MNLKNKEHFENEIYLVRQKELKVTKNGKEYLRLELYRNERRIFAHLWVYVKHWYNALNFASVLNISGQIESLNNHSIIRIKKIAWASSKEAKKVNIISESGANWLEQQIESLPNEFRKLLKEIYQSENIYKFLLYPAGKLWAFNYEGGLLKKTQQIFHHLESLDRYKMNIPLIKTAVLIQAVGFFYSMHVGEVFEYNSRAKLLKVPIISLLETEETLKKHIHNYDTRIHLEHLVLTLPVRSEEKKDLKAMSMEAVSLYRIQQLVSEIDAINSIKERPENIKRSWTAFNKRLNRYLYIGGDREEKL